MVISGTEYLNCSTCRIEEMPEVHIYIYVRGTSMYYVTQVFLVRNCLLGDPDFCKF